MLMIRLQRTGRKHEPTFRLVLTDSRNSTKSGRYLEVLGNHDPRKDNTTHLEEARIKHWMSKGAQLSATVHNMLIEKKIITGKKINVLPRKSPPKKDEEATAPTVAEVKADAKVEMPAEAPVEAPAETPTPTSEATPEPTPQA